MSTGIERRDAGMALAIENAPLDYKAELISAIDWLIDLGVPFTADDVRGMVPALVERAWRDRVPIDPAPGHGPRPLDGDVRQHPQRTPRVITKFPHDCTRARCYDNNLT